ncbi:MAG: hypothetical protein RJQ14_09220, partial [Marinoscillum sp.]
MKLSKKTAIVFLLGWVALSCTEDDLKGDSEQLKAAKITVYDANSWKSENTPLDFVVGAEIKLYKDITSFNSRTP